MPRVDAVLWAAISALVSTQVTAAGSGKRGFRRIVGTGVRRIVGTAAGAALALMLAAVLAPVLAPVWHQS